MKMWKLSHTGRGETDYISSYDVVMPPNARGQTWLFHPLPVSTVPQTLGGIYLTLTIEDSMKKINKFREPSDIQS